MTTFLVFHSMVAMALAVPAFAFSRATATALPAEPSLANILSTFAGDVRRLPSSLLRIPMMLADR